MQAGERTTNRPIKSPQRRHQITTKTDLLKRNAGRGTFLPCLVKTSCVPLRRTFNVKIYFFSHIFDKPSEKRLNSRLLFASSADSVGAYKERIASKRPQSNVHYNCFISKILLYSYYILCINIDIIIFFTILNVFTILHITKLNTFLLFRFFNCVTTTLM